MTEEDKLYADELKNRALADHERLDRAINELERQFSYSSDDIFEAIEKFTRLQREYKEQKLAEIIAKYDFIVGSKECKRSIARGGKYYMLSLCRKSDNDLCNKKVRHNGFNYGNTDGKRGRRIMNDYVTDINVGKIESDDCISREAVGYYIQSYIHEIITESGTDKNEHSSSILRAILNGIKTMPSVQPTRPTGKWIEKTGEGFDAWAECSKCGCVNPFEDDFNYCPNCGARMQESEGKDGNTM